jgi:hypothetical protein
VRDVVVYTIELLVGAGCVVIAVPSWQRGGWFRVAAVVLGFAGLAAIVHAVTKLAT